MTTTVHDTRLHDIYRMRDLSGRLLYIGVTNGGLRRFMEHAKDKTWWREVAQIDVEHLHCSRTVIEAVEREAIQTERPLYNVVHNRTAELPPPKAVPNGSDLVSKLVEAGIGPHTPIRQAILDAREYGIFASAAAMGGALAKMRAHPFAPDDPDSGDCADEERDYSDCVPVGTLKVGDKVEHATHGVGLVVDVFKDAKYEEVATVAFERDGTKNLCVPWSPMVLISDPFDFLVSNGGHG